MPNPIFVVGIQRSGTTWLANILCQHSNIVGIQAERHFGIHESAFFSHLKGRFGDLQDENNFIQFVEVLASSDYFILSGLQKELFYEERPRTYPEAFRLLMDRFAEAKGAKYWVEKTPAHSLYLEEIAMCYPDAKFVGVRRNVIDTVKSVVQRQRGMSTLLSRMILLVKAVFHYCRYMKHIDHHLRKTDSMMVVNYEELRQTPQRVLSGVCQFLGVEFESQMLECRYQPNTSFRSDTQRASVLSASEVLLVKLTYGLLRLFPYRIYRIMSLAQRAVGREPLPDWFFTIKMEQLRSVSKDSRP